MTIVICDISKWQGDIDFAVMARRAQGVYIKATESKTGIDPRFIDNWQAAKAAGLVRGAYHFFRAHADATSPRKQAENFYRALAGDYGELPPMLDVESNDDNLSKQQFVDAISKFIARFYELTGLSVGVYTRANFWDKYIASDPGNTDIPRVQGGVMRPLWVAHYSSTAKAPAVPFDWRKRFGAGGWTFWQWSAGGNGQGGAYGAESDDIDLNRYNGSVSDFNLRFGVNVKPLSESDPAPEPEPAPTLPDAVIVKTKMNLRSKPMGTIIGAAPKDLILLVNDSQVYKGQVWYRSGPAWFAGWCVEVIA